MEILSTVISMAGIYFTTVVRWVFVILAIFILTRQIRSLIQARNPSEIWAYLGCPDGSSVPLTHWENLMGRGKGCDVILNLNSVSRSHGTLIRDSAGVWKYRDLQSKNGSLVNGKLVTKATVIKAGDVLTIGGADFTLYPVSLQERMANIEKRKRRTHPVSPWPSLVALTIFQVLAIIQFRVALEEEFTFNIIAGFGLLIVLEWAYVIVMRMFKRVGFEMEIIAFFLSALSLAVTTSAYQSTVFKQAICVCLGVALFFGMCWFLRDLNRTKKIAYALVAISVVLLIFNLVFGSFKYGATNWVSIGGFSFQPSELVKIVFIFIGAATLDELQQKKNLTVFLLFSVFCLGCLAIMGDFGTAIIFFVTFLIISFLRSGDFTKLFLIIGAAGLMGMMVLRFKPYIASRFDTWGHVWEDPTDGGYQQVQTMSCSASGGMAGLGAGNGRLSGVAASSTDLVFGLIGEEWGLIIAILAVLCIITLGVFAVRSIIAGRSTYYSIAACAATSMFIFQTILNVFGSVDLLPLTGVTFPFVSAGGTSMIASWGMLAYLKAADTRQNASFAIRLDKKGEFENEMDGGDLENPEDIINSVDGRTSKEAEYEEYMRQRMEQQRAKKTEYDRQRKQAEEEYYRQREQSSTSHSSMENYDEVRGRRSNKQRPASQQHTQYISTEELYRSSRNRSDASQGQSQGRSDFNLYDFDEHSGSRSTRASSGARRQSGSTGRSSSSANVRTKSSSNSNATPSKPAKSKKKITYTNIDDDEFFNMFGGDDKK